MSDRLGILLRIVSLAWLAGSACLSGCATVPMASAEDEARMKSLAPAPGAALVYVYRNESMGYSVHMDVSLDEVPYGQTVAKSFLVWEVRPGRHTIRSAAENDSTLTLSATPGRRYFVWQEVNMGLMYARSTLHEVSEDEGQRGVDECHLIQMPLPRRRTLRPPAQPPASAPAPPPPGVPQPPVASPPAPQTS